MISLPHKVADIIGLFVVFLLSFQPCSGSDIHLDVEIWCDRDAYLPFEPILIHYNITNVSDNNIITCVELFRECFHITDQNGVRYNNSLIISALMGDTLSPRESLQSGEFIESRYNINRPGQYTIYLHIPEDICLPVQVGGNRSNSISIRIDNPVGEDMNALEMLLRADYSGDNHPNPEFAIGHPRDAIDNRNMQLRKRYEILIEIADTYPESVYAPLALFRAMGITRIHADNKILISLGKRILEEYPESIFADRPSLYNRLIKMIVEDEGKARAVEYLTYLAKKSPRDSNISQRSFHYIGLINSGNFD